MIRTLMFVSAFALAAPALAQETQPPQEPATESTAAQPPAEAQTAPEAATPSTTTTASPAQAAPANSANTVAAVVDNDFPAFDADKNGELSKEEFAAWMTKLRAAQPNAAAASTDNSAWTEAAFAQADTDKSKSVSKGELTTFLQG
ncbi:EF-hand domain-containing protein [Sphingomonas colocasiae]|uniref:EF-hand domain-containing protein n=1 Tax=Sphingomonas colocasiae TaxID=1848973 RepID=A0ABS7PNA1_9SPHN|nr:EF-hand domain-containing protein [Sphingomonas colocasiae]MBY8822708.1 EF-hand domain-containing protein [Sphingomonas colocasiae]